MTALLRTPLLRSTTLGEAFGGTALLKAELLQKTGSFKARGLSAAVTRAVLAGAERFVLPTAGNAGIAAAAYGAPTYPASIAPPSLSPPPRMPDSPLVASPPAGSSANAGVAAGAKAHADASRITAFVFMRVPLSQPPQTGQWPAPSRASSIAARRSCSASGAAAGSPVPPTDCHVSYVNWYLPR